MLPDPDVVDPVGHPHKASVQGLGTYTLPDGSTAKDGAGFSGQFYTQSVWIDPEA